MSIKIWVDDVRPAPPGYIWSRSVNDAKNEINRRISMSGVSMIDEINLDHDAGEFVKFGGDYIKILDWIENIQNVCNYKFHKTVFKFHSMNPVGVENMKRICRANGWRHE